MRPLIRKIHKYLSLFVSIQLLLWTVSGIYFAYNKIELVRGEHLRNQKIEELSFDLTRPSRNSGQVYQYFYEDGSAYY